MRPPHATPPAAGCSAAAGPDLTVAMQGTSPWSTGGGRWAVSGAQKPPHRHSNAHRPGNWQPAPALNETALTAGRDSCLGAFENSRLNRGQVLGRGWVGAPADSAGRPPRRLMHGKSMPARGPTRRRSVVDDAPAGTAAVGGAWPGVPLRRRERGSGIRSACVEPGDLPTGKVKDRKC